MAHRGRHRSRGVWLHLGLVAVLASAGCGSSVRERGDELMSAGRPAQAIEVWEEALVERPRDTKLLTRIATAYTRLRKFPEAEATLERAVGVAPKDAAVRHNLGLVYLKQKKFDKALATFKQVLELQDTYPGTNYFVGLIHEMRGDVKVAKKFYVREVNHGASVGAWDRIWTLNRKSRRTRPSERGIFVFSFVLLGAAAVAYGLRVYLEVRQESGLTPPGS